MRHFFTSTIAALSLSTLCAAQVAVRGGTVHTMAGEAIENGVVLIEDGKIAAVGSADSINIPPGYDVIEAAVVTPGLIDARATVGLSGWLNQDQDQDQLEESSPIQPELRALDAYNPLDPLVAWVRSFGVTTVHTGHGPGQLISGQTMLVKTTGTSVEEALIRQPVAVVAMIGSGAQNQGKAPGTRGKMMSMLRSQFLDAQDYMKKQDEAEEGKAPPRDLKKDMLASILRNEIPLLIRADRVQDIASALRLADEFDIEIMLNSASDAHMMIDEIKASGFPVILHPSMARPFGDRENLSFTTADKLIEAGIPVAFQSGFEGYVPKTRVVLFEAAIFAANGVSFDDALGAITIDAARMLGVDDRIGSLEVGKDADIALYDGDPFEYTSHCVGVLIDGVVVNDTAR
jgi:imidazolonepropionase-like amidohydrolase